MSEWEKFLIVILGLVVLNGCVWTMVIYLLGGWNE